LANPFTTIIIISSSSIHCKFYVALYERANQNQRNPEKLPEMKPLVNIKATEKAVILSTKFHQSQMMEAKHSSNICMSHVSLNDHHDWGAGAVFGYKLYY
jgi:hypothetical protein